MTSSDERLTILKMIQEGKITPEEGLQLMETLEESTSGSPRTKNQATPPSNNSGRWFRVRVTDTDSGKTRANVRLPLSMVKSGIKMGMHFTPQVEGLELDKLTEFIESGEIGQIVDVYDDDDGEHVEVYIE